MFDFNIQLSKRSNADNVTLTQPIYYYVVFTVISLLVLNILILNGFTIVPLIIFLISILALTYKEKWIFNRTSESISFTTGIGLIYSTKEFNFKDIDTLEKVSFVKGKRGDIKEGEKLPFFMTRFHSINIYFKNGKQYTILTTKESKKEQITRIESEISAISGVSFK